MLDSVGIKKIEEKNKEFLTEKIFTESNLKTSMLQILKNQKLCVPLKETIELQEEYTSSSILILQNFLQILSDL